MYAYAAVEVPWLHNPGNYMNVLFNSDYKSINSINLHYV